VIGLNVVYLLMFNGHDTTHVCARKRGREKERERSRKRERERNRERGRKREREREDNFGGVLGQ